MKNYKKNFLIFVLVTLLFQNFLLSKSQFPSDGYDHPEGLAGIKLHNGTPEHQSHWRNGDKFWLNEDNLLEFSNIKKWMEEEGLKFSKYDYKRVVRGIRDCVGGMWLEAIDKLMNCPKFRNHQRSSTMKKFLERLKEHPRYIKFVDKDGRLSTTTGAAMDGMDVHMLVHFADLERIVRYMSKKVLNRNKNIDDLTDKEKYPLFHKLIGFIGHEMLHTFGLLQKDSRKGEGRPPTLTHRMFECEVHCLQRECLDSNHTHMPKECDKEGKDRFCDEKNTCEFWFCPNPLALVALNRIMTPDDNYSYFTGAALSSNDVMPSQIVGDFSSFNFYPDVLVYNKYEYTEITQLLDKYKLDFISDYSHDYFDNNHKVLVIPSGEWMGEEQSEITREAIRQFVNQGGTIIVLSQQYDEHIQGLVPIPEGETLTSYGWRQDQSCYSGSVYFNGMHPDTDWGASHLT